MKSFIRRTAGRLIGRSLALGAISLSLVGSSWAVSPAFALSDEQVSQQRSTVLTYIIEGENGPIYLEVPDQGLINILGFMSEESARDFIAQNSPEQAEELTIVPTNLELVYQFVEQVDNDSLRFTLVPEEAEVQQALSVDADYEGGVPLFFPQIEEGVIFAFQQGESEEPIFPMFFSREDLDESLQSLAAAAPDVYAELSVGVVPLRVVLQRIQTSDDEMLNQIRLLPSDVVDAIREINDQPSAPPAVAPQAE